MLRLLSLLLLAFPAFATLDIGTVSADHISHGSALVHWHINSGLPWGSVRFRWGASPYDCTTGTGGHVQEAYYPTDDGYPYSRLNDTSTHDWATRNAPDSQMILGGLPASTQISVCAEFSLDGGTWTSGNGTTFTTLAGHAAGNSQKPITPETFDTSYPDMTGAIEHTPGTDCANVTACLNDAVNDQTSHKHIIWLQAGQTYTGTLWVGSKAGDRHSFTADTTNKYIITTGHGLQTGDRVRFGKGYPSSCVIGGDCSRVYDDQGIQPGRFYYVQKIDDNQFQLYSGATQANGGTLIPLVSQPGSAWWVNAERPNLNWIVIRTTTADNQFDPEGVRISPKWTSKMATLQVPANQVRGVQNPNILFAPEGIDGNDEMMTAKIRFVGVRFTYENDGTNQTGPDDYVGYHLLNLPATTGQIVVDRCIVDPNGTPTYTAIWFDGYKNAIVDSYIVNLTKGHGIRYGMDVTQ